MVRMGDFDGNGYPDVLVDGLFMGTRIYFLEEDRVRDSLQVEPEETPSESC